MTLRLRDMLSNLSVFLLAFLFLSGLVSSAGAFSQPQGGDVDFGYVEFETNPDTISAGMVFELNVQLRNFSKANLA